MREAFKVSVPEHGHCSLQEVITVSLLEAARNIHYYSLGTPPTTIVCKTTSLPQISRGIVLMSTRLDNFTSCESPVAHTEGSRTGQVPVHYAHNCHLTCRKYCRCVSTTLFLAASRNTKNNRCLLKIGHVFRARANPKSRKQETRTRINPHPTKNISTTEEQEARRRNHQLHCTNSCTLRNGW